MKVFTGTVFIPREWMETVLQRNHHNQGTMMVVAHRKADVAALLTDRGLSQGSADRHAKELRMRRPPYHWQPVVALFESGLASADVPGVYAWDLDAGRDKPVVRLELDGTLTVLGHFARNDTGGMTVVPVAEEPADDDESAEEELLGCGYSWDHTLKPGHTECSECGTDLSEWLTENPESK